MKNSLSRRLFQKYGLPPRGYQWGATSFLPTQGILIAEFSSVDIKWQVVGTIYICFSEDFLKHRGRSENQSCRVVCTAHDTQ